MPVSPVSGRIDAFEWKVPLTEIGHDGAELDLAKDAPLLVEDRPVSVPVSSPPVPDVIATPVRPAEAERKPVKPVRAPPAQDIVVPLVHVPDDPGPDPELEREPLPEPTSPAPGWRRFFSW
jgi:HemY protein